MRSLGTMLLPILVLVGTLARLAAGVQVHNIDPNQNTFSLPVTYSMAAPSGGLGAGTSPSAQTSRPVLHHFKTIRGSTSSSAVTTAAPTTASDETSSTPARYSSSYSMQREPQQVLDEQALMQKQHSYQSLHDYQANSQNSYQNLASVQGYQQLTSYTPNVLSYQSGSKQAAPEAAAPSSSGSSGIGDESGSKTPVQEVSNAVSIEEAVAAAAAVTQTPELTPQQKQQLQLQRQQQEYRLQQQQLLLQRQHEHLFALQQQQLQQQQQQQKQLQQKQQQQQQLQAQQGTTAAYERFYEAVAATGATRPPLSAYYSITTPRVPVRAGVAGASASSPVMAAAMQYYKQGYFVDPSLLYQMSRPPYRRVSAPSGARPVSHSHSPVRVMHTARPRPVHHVHPTAPHSYKTSLHRIGDPNSRSPQVQHFFHGPYTMEAGIVPAHHYGEHQTHSFIDHAIEPVKREDSLLSSLGTAPGSSTALLNGLLVPIVLLGLSIPALGFAYSYLSRRRGFDNDLTNFVANLRPSEETLDYYFNSLQKAIECYNDPKPEHCD